MNPHVFCRFIGILLMFTAVLFPSTTNAYSILTHEAVIDASWQKSIVPLLKKKFPNATDADLKLAHSYAYGGSLMTDIGYSPYGSVYFTNLIHYVRTGDFVDNLLSEAQNINEYAYAIGALCHYMADAYGHSIGTNHVVPMVYPKLKAQFGDVINYEQNHEAHSRVELAFDVLQLARGNYESQGFHDMIGFNVAIPVLERAFFKTYGQDINVIFPDIDRSVSNFRWAVNSLMPTITRSAWVLKKKEIKESEPGITARKFHYRMQRKKYNLEYGNDYDQPKFKERLIAFLLVILPKIGPLKTFRFKEVGHDGEKQFIKSFDTVMVRYKDALTRLETGPLKLPNVNFDTGNITTPEEYALADQSYNQLLVKLQDNKFSFITPPLKQNLLDFYAKADTNAMKQKDEPDWKKAAPALQQLQMAATISADSLRSAEVNQELKRAIKKQQKGIKN